jgi:diguanylate cyclase (GGDEF)-like protein
MLASTLFSGSMAYIFARLTDEQRELLSTEATEDTLTRLGNRRLMNQELALCIDDYMRGAPATLILLDLDRFKQTNDQFGHNTGDQLLIDAAQLLKQRARKTDRVFRYGGEEFVILARNTTLIQAKVVAEDLRRRIESRLQTPSGSVTASFGCAQLKNGEDAAVWFERADQAMFEAKRRGRNRVVLGD